MIGFIGLGAMGRPMASRLSAAGFSLLVYDRDGVHAERVAQEIGAEVAADVSEVARRSTAIILMLPDQIAISNVVLGAASVGLIDTLRPGTVVVDMSSSSPLASHKIAVELAARSVRFIDAPVSGGVSRAANGRLTIMIGATVEETQALAPLFAAMGERMFHLGQVGAGHLVKALNNFVSAAGFAAAGEALLAAKRLNLDPEMVVDVLNASSGRNNSTETKLKQFVLSETYASGFALALMAKDLRIAREAIEASGLPGRIIRPMSDVWTEAEQASTPGADHTAIVRFLDKAPTGRDQGPQP